MIAFLMEHKAVFLGLLFAISEALALIPSVKSNGIFQWLFNLLKGLVVKDPVPPAV